MDWMEKNTEAYRILAGILSELRAVVRDRLIAIHGQDWHSKGLPEQTLASIVARKEREVAIDWYESEYQELIDFAGFAEILQVVESNPQVLPFLAQLAPSPELLHARFLELEVLRSKVGMTRPVSDTELSFLKTFNGRFRKAIQGGKVVAAGAQKPPSARRTAAVAETPAGVPPREPELVVTIAHGASAAPASPLSGGRRQGDLGTRPVPVMGGKPDAAVAAVSEEELAEPEPLPEVEESLAPLDPAEIMVEEPPPAKVETWQQPTLESALGTNDHRTVLREVYKEVTSLAEGIWSGSAPPVTVVWERVSVSDWYERNFSRLGLQPVSDFYGIISQVRQRLGSGASRAELQEYLKSANFAQTLLALRNMFQKNQI